LAQALEKAADGGGGSAAGAAPGRDDAERPAHGESGEGIGLSIVKRLCELLDATIELKSIPNVGTTFRILFPRRYTS